MGWQWRKSLVSGWGPFEFVDMCVAAGIEPVVTTSAQSDNCCDPKDMADLVEYVVHLHLCVCDVWFSFSTLVV